MRKSSSSFAVIALVAIASVGMAGCFGSQSTTQRGPLSEAVKAASDDNTGSRVVETPPDNERSSSYQTRDTTANDPFWFVSLISDISNINAQSGTVEVRRENLMDVIDTATEPSRVWLGLAGGAALIDGDDFAGLSNVTFTAGGDISKRGRLEATVGYSGAPLRASSSLARSIDDDLYMLTAGIQYKLFTTPRHTFLGHYFVLGGGYGSMSWNYRNAIVSDGDVIRDDGLDFVEMYLGTGINLLQFSRVQLGIEALPGVIVWNHTTNKGFHNLKTGDFDFSDVAFIKLRVVMGLRLAGD